LRLIDIDPLDSVLDRQRISAVLALCLNLSYVLRSAVHNDSTEGRVAGLDTRESELCRALLDTYLTRDDFEELLADIGKNLNSIVESSVNLRITVRRVVRTAKAEGWLGALEAAALADKPDSPALKRWHQKHCAPRRPGHSAPGTVPAWQQFDPLYFDLTPIRAAILQAMMVASSTVLGFGVRYWDFAFVNKLRDIVMGHLVGVTQCKDVLSLKPEYDKLSRKVDRVRGYGQDLDSANVLCVVLVDTAPTDHFARFWEQVRQGFGGGGNQLILLFVGDESTAFPPGVTELPQPRFDKDDLVVWAANTVMQIKWPVTLAAAWTELLCAGADTGAGLDVGMVYEAMDRSIKEIRFDAEGFRRKLENRISE
jgi:hypothetical protein